MLGDGTLAGYIEELSVTGLTSNPTIFDKAISGGDAYDEQIAELAPRRLLDRGAVLRAGALRPARGRRPLRRRARAHRRGRRLLLARGLAEARRRHEATIEQAAQLHGTAGRENLFIKIPGTPAGLTAIEESIFAGIPINVTLLFSQRALPRRGRRLHEGDRTADRGGARPLRRLGRLDLHQPLGRRGAGRGPRASCATGSASRSATAPTAPTASCSSPTAGAAADERRGPAAAAALGEHRAPRTRTPPTPSTSRALPRPSPSTRCPSRPCTPSPTTASSATRCPRTAATASEVLAEFERAGDRRRGPRRAPPGGGQAEVRRLLERAAEVDRGRARAGRMNEERAGVHIRGIAPRAKRERP